ncbi:MAG: hypothetical protein KIH89_001280 [Candidatus Shapirobacteria bacterium]|nr:hypothetical protein [Candidatus Shapirobacteria bacterium]
MSTKNSTYIILGLILLILAGIGGYFLFQVYLTNQQVSYTSTTTPKIELLPTDSPTEEIVEVTPSVITPTASVSGKITPTAVKTTIAPTKIPTATATSAASSSTSQTFISDTDSFSIVYSLKRKLYQDFESTLYDTNGNVSQDKTVKGNRYTFYNAPTNFAVHVSPGTVWSWKNPDRQFSQSSLISGQPSYRYDIAAQTIIDLQYNNKNYTIQCIHNGNSTLKTECEAFISSFKLL